jgi:hypothetical protein
MPINHKGRLPALATLTPIDPHLAVQYQMYVITQLPHVMLLSTTLRQGAPTSLSKCVFGTHGETIAELRAGEKWSFAAICTEVCNADEVSFRCMCANLRFDELFNKR